MTEETPEPQPDDALPPPTRRPILSNVIAGPVIRETAIEAQQRARAKLASSERIARWRIALAWLWLMILRLFGR
jgi:hypothetical protein